MNTAIPSRAAERSRRIFFPSERPAVARLSKSSPVALRLASLFISRIQRAALCLRG